MLSESDRGGSHMLSIETKNDVSEGSKGAMLDVIVYPTMIDVWKSSSDSPRSSMVPATPRS